MAKQDILTGMLLFFVPLFGLVARLGALEGSFARARFRGVGGVFGSEVWFVIVGFGVSLPESTRFCKRARFSGVQSMFFSDEVSKFVVPIGDKLCFASSRENECASGSVVSASSLSISLEVCEGVRIRFSSMVAVVMADPSGANFSYVVCKTWLLHASIASLATSKKNTVPRQ